MSDAGRVWGWWKIVWSILRNLIEIAVVLLMFGKASTAFENLVLCSLILIYQYVTWMGTVQTRIAVEEGTTIKRLLLRILRKVGEAVEEMDDFEEEISKFEKNYAKGIKFYYIDNVFNAIIYLIVVWKLFTTLLD